jgi:hypothetical protein
MKKLLTVLDVGMEGEASMRRRINSLLGSVFTKKTVPALVVVAIFSMLLAASTAVSTELGTRDRFEPDPSAAETGMGPNPFRNYQQPGADFIKAGTTTRVNNPLTGVPQTEPFVLIVPALPAGAIPVETFVCWNYLLDGAAPAMDGITINGNPVNGTLIGTGSPDLCWNKDGAASYMFSDATNLVNPGPAPVNVTIGGATDKALGADSIAYGEGLTILVVYEVPGDPWRNVDLYRGYISNTSGAGGVGTATLNYTRPYLGHDFHFFLSGLDGQTSPDSFCIDGINRGGQVSGTVAANDAWQGLLGPGPAGVDNLYDHANDDISAFLTVNDVSLNISTYIISDCVGHSFAAISFPTGYPGPSLTQWGLIALLIILAGIATWVVLKRRRIVTA